MDFLVIQPAATSMERCGSGYSREVSTHAQPTHIAVNSGLISSSDVNPFRPQQQLAPDGREVATKLPGIRRSPRHATHAVQPAHLPRPAR